MLLAWLCTIFLIAIIIVIIITYLLGTVIWYNTHIVKHCTISRSEYNIHIIFARLRLAVNLPTTKD